MAFQFTCPQGHLLEADASLAGQQCTCPHCRMLFIIPPPPAQPMQHAPAMMHAPAPQHAPPAVYQAPGMQPAIQQMPAPQYAAAPAPYAPAGAFGPPQPAPAPFAAPQFPAPQPAFPQVGPQVGPSIATGPSVAVGPAASVAAPVDVTKPAEPVILHIPCPNGHELDTPREMLNSEVLCPHCGEQFLLREKDSVEYKRKKQQEAEIKEYKSGKAWLNWAIVFAVLVVIGLVVLILATSG